MESSERIALQLKTEILQGAYGKSGERFMSIRELANTKNISYSLAHKVFHLLEADGLLFLIKQIWYLTYGVAAKTAPLRRLTGEPTVGIHVKELNNPYIGSIVASISLLLSKHGYQAVIQTSENDTQKELEILRYFVKIGCVGVINFPSTSGALSAFYRLYPLPLVFVGRMIYISDAEYMPCVLSDNYGMSKTIARKFLAHDYKHYYYVGLASLPDERNERLKGFRDGINEAATFDQENLFKVEYTNDLAFKQFCKSVISKANRENPALLFCVNDLYAAKIVSNLLTLGADIPASISVLGYDDLPICQYTSPTLSSVAYSFSHIAEQAVSLLFSIHNGKTQTNQKIIIPNYLIHRETTKAK